MSKTSAARYRLAFCLVLENFVVLVSLWLWIVGVGGGRMNGLWLWSELGSGRNNIRVRDHYEIYRKRWLVWFIPSSFRIIVVGPFSWSASDPKSRDTSDVCWVTPTEVAPLTWSVDSTSISTVFHRVLEGRVSDRVAEVEAMLGEYSHDWGRIMERHRDWMSDLISKFEDLNC